MKTEDFQHPKPLLDNVTYWASFLRKYCSKSVFEEEVHCLAGTIGDRIEDMSNTAHLLDAFSCCQVAVAIA